MRAKMVGLLLMVVLTGCGQVDWFPEVTGSEDKVEVKSLGKFLGSSRIEAGGYDTRAEKGVFETYTSLSVPVGSPVVYEVHTDKGTGLLLGRLLRSSDRAVLVKKTVSVD